MSFSLMLLCSWPSRCYLFPSRWSLVRWESRQTLLFARTFFAMQQHRSQPTLYYCFIPISLHIPFCLPNSGEHALVGNSRPERLGQQGWHLQATQGEEFVACLPQRIRSRFVNPFNQCGKVCSLAIRNRQCALSCMAYDSPHCISLVTLIGRTWRLRLRTHSERNGAFACGTPESRTRFASYDEAR